MFGSLKVKYLVLKVGKDVLFMFLFLVSYNSHSQENDDRFFNFPLRKEINLLTAENYNESREIIERYLKIAEQESYAEDKYCCYINQTELNVSIRDFSNSTL